MKYSFFILSFCLALCAGCGSGVPGTDDLESGITGVEQGRSEYGLKMLQNALAKGLDDKQEAVAHNCVGIAHWRMGKPDLAMLAFETSMELDPGFAEPVYNMGVLMAERELWNDAAGFFEKAAAVESDGTRSLEYLAYAYSRSGDPGRARTALQKALNIAPRSPRIITALATLDLQAGQVEKAVSGFQYALEHDPAYPPAVYNLGIVNERWLKNHDQARAYLEEYAGLASVAPYADRALMVLKDIEEAKPAPESEKAPPPESPPAVSVSVPVKKACAEEPVAETRAPASGYNEHMNMAKMLERQERVEAAVYNYLRAAMMAEAEKKTDLKEDALNKAVQAASDNARAHYSLGMYFLERQRNDEALAHFRRASDLSKDWADPYIALADILADNGEMDAAVVCLRQADRSQPDNPDALWSLAQLHDQRTGLTNHAVQCYSWFIRRFPSDARSEQAAGRLKELQ